MSEKIKVLDTTLRDGEQTPGVAFSPEEKLEIAKSLDDLGIDVIEAGSAITSAGEREGIKKVTNEGLGTEILSFARGKKSDIDSALECDVDGVHLVLPASDLRYREETSEI